jgi:hypothetical protein
VKWPLDQQGNSVAGFPEHSMVAAVLCASPADQQIPIVDTHKPKHIQSNLHSPTKNGNSIKPTLDIRNKGPEHF